MSTTPANWYPDPTGRNDHRYWDGQAWTDHVSNQGITGTDPVQTAPTRLDRLDGKLTVGNEANPELIQRMTSGDGTRRSAAVGAPSFAGSGSIFDEPVLIVNQKAKIIELNNQYGVFDRNGTQLAAVNQVGQSTAKKVLRLVSSLDQFLTHQLEITDANGNVALRLTRPAKVFKSTVLVSDGHDREIGRIVQDNVFGKIHFTLQAGEHTYGSIRAENWRAWDFRIDDHTGTEVARITKTFEGLAKTLFTTADNYVVQIHTKLPQPLNALVVASALSVDTALKQDSRGFG
ncbi:MAG: phospholipid scramblase-related protein [Actinobacteria bacterium]|nr:phospholipid scramblase-related protein [Actinomycetota bacterium]